MVSDFFATQLVEDAQMKRLEIPAIEWFNEGDASEQGRSLGKPFYSNGHSGLINSPLIEWLRSQAQGTADRADIALGHTAAGPGQL